jgi:hypothetical protein
LSSYPQESYPQVYPHDKRHKKYYLGRLLFLVGVGRVITVTHTPQPSVPQALKDILENIIQETTHNGDSQTVEDWAQSLANDNINLWGRDWEGNAVYGIASDDTVQDILALVLQALNEMFDEHQPNLRRTEAHGAYLPY